MSEPKPWRRWVRRILVTLLLAFVAFVIQYAIRREITKHRLEDAIAEQVRNHPGWRFDDLLAAREDVPDTENAALQVQAVKQLMGDWKPSKLPARLVTYPANRRLPAVWKDQLRGEIDPVNRALAAARRLAGMEKGKLSIRYKEDFLATLVPEYEHARATASLQQYDAFVRGTENDLRGALESCRAQIGVARSFGSEPSTLAQVLRMLCTMEACQSSQWVLGQGEAAVEDLVALQSMLEKENHHRYFEISAWSERAVAHRTFDAIERGAITVDELMGKRKKEGGLFAFWEKDGMRQFHLAMFPPYNRLVEIAALPIHERREPLATFFTDVLTAPRTPATPVVPALEKIDDVERRGLGWVRCTIAALAAERYRKQNGSWPAKLDDLRPLAPADALIDPSDGQPLRLLRLPDGILIYSVGADGIDDGGEIDPDEPNRPGTDLGFRLWNADQRGQPPEPDEPPPPDGPPQ